MGWNQVVLQRFSMYRYFINCQSLIPIPRHLLKLGNCNSTNLGNQGYTIRRVRGKDAPGLVATRNSKP